MLFWVALSVMTVAAVSAALWPLRHGPLAAATRSDGDSAVYRDQLDEIERDLAAGSIGAREAEAARVEISRRLLAAHEAEAARGTLGRTATPPVFVTQLALSASSC